MSKPVKIQFKADSKPAGLEYKSVDARLEVKAVDDSGILHIKAYALAFGNVDSWLDIILPGACDTFLAGKDADRMALCYQHDISTVIGKITDKGVDETGMWIEADVLPTSVGKDVAILLKAGAVKEFSIGYRADEWEWKKMDEYADPVRLLKAITIYEVSPVTIAANPKATIVSAKSDPNPKTNTDNNSSQTINTNEKHMTPEEIKAMRESIEKAASEKVAAEVKAMKEEIQAKQEKIDAQEKSIDNLDKSMKALQAKSEELAKQLETKQRVTFLSALRATMEEKREEIKSMIEAQKGSLKMEFEVKDDPAVVTTSDITNIAYGVALEPGIHTARPVANVFYNSFPKDTVRATQFDWLEGTFTDAADYVDELAKPDSDDIAVVEHSRKFGKIAAHLRVSSETADFFEEVYNWARTTAQQKIIAKIDAEILSGAGADSGAGTSPKKVYGLKTNSTAFSATGNKYKDATIYDVILDAQAQAIAYGYVIDKVFASYADFGAIKGVKDANGHYLYNEATGMLGGIAIEFTTRLTTGQLLCVENNVVRIKERPTWELEIVRAADVDGWDVYVRKAVQTLVKSNDKKGVIWVASVSSAISAITEASSAAASAEAIAAIADTIDETTGAIKTKAVTE